MEENKKQERTFIHEQIVPRKNYKKIILTVLCTVGLAILFGITAAVTNQLAEKLLVGETEGMKEQVIIVRDDPSDQTSQTSKTTAAKTESTKPSTGGNGQDPTETLPSDEGDEVTMPTDAEDEEETPIVITTTDLEEEMRAAYDVVKNAIVTLTITTEKGVDWFETQILSRQESFGVIFTESTTRIFILADGMHLPDNALITTTVNGVSAAAKVIGYDKKSGLAILTVEKQEAMGGITCVSLGNSFRTHTMDTVYMAGAPLGINGTVMSGQIISIESYRGVVDGYDQLIYTDMVRTEGGSGFLFNKNGVLIGWVSDYTMVEGTNLAVACGISPLKYLIEDMCVERATAYLGIRCAEISSVSAEDTTEETIANPLVPIETTTAAAYTADGLTAGLYALEIEADSPAYNAGIQIGDRLVSLAGKSVLTNHILQLRIDNLSAYQEIPVVVERRTATGTETLTLTVALGHR